MSKRRLIFTLLLDKGVYQLSRNFSLQAAGDLAWLKDFYSFDSIAQSIDELVLLNVERGKRDLARFSENILELTQGCFMPIAAGGGIASIDDAFLLMRSGADKLVLNSAFYSSPELVRELVATFGSQCVVASIDFRWQGDRTDCVIHNGAVSTGKTVEESIQLVETLGAGEIYLRSVTRDGTGQGYELDVLKRAVASTRLPVVAAGGVGTFEHLAEGIHEAGASAVSTANLFNFMADGLSEARGWLIKRGIPLAVWSTKENL